MRKTMKWSVLALACGAASSILALGIATVTLLKKKED